MTIMDEIQRMCHPLEAAIDPPESSINPIIEQWGKMRKVLKETHDMMNKALEYMRFS